MTPATPEPPVQRWLRYGGIAAIVLAFVTFVVLPEARLLGQLLVAGAVVVWVYLLVVHFRQRRAKRGP